MHRGNEEKRWGIEPKTTGLSQGLVSYLSPITRQKGVPNHACNVPLKFKSDGYLHLGVDIGSSRLICNQIVHDKIS